jgi:hypothetical protein
MPRRTRELAFVAAVAALAGVSGCAAGPVFRAKKPIAASNDDLSVQVTGVDSRYTDDGLVVVGRLLAPPDAAVRGASLANPNKSLPCEAPRHRASALALDGAASWRRPLPAPGDHAVTLDFPESIGLHDLQKGPMALDVETDRAGVAGCLRVPIQTEGDQATWTPTVPWMLGLRFSAPPLAFGLGAGRWVGPLVLGIEGEISGRRGGVAAVAAAEVWQGLGVDVSYAGAWARPGGTEPAGTFRNGPRLGVLLGQEAVSGRFERLVLSGFELAVQHWWAENGQPASTVFTFGLTAWWSPFGV